MRSACCWWTGIIVTCALAVLPAASSAAPFSVESPTHVSRETADDLLKKVVQAGADEELTRIVRRYERGAGWRFLVQIDEVGEIAQVKQFAGVMADGERTPRVVDLATGAVVEIEPPPAKRANPPAAAAADPGKSAEATSRRSRREADGVLAAAVVAHGGVAGGLAAIEKATNVTFQFVREVPVDGGTLKAKHVYRHSSDDGWRLDVRVQKGSGVDSTTVVAPDGGAWVVTDGQTVPRDPARTKEIVGRFAPDQLLRVALGVAADIESATAWRELRVVGPEGDDLVVLRPEGGPVGGLVEVAFARTDHRLRRLTLRDHGRETVYFFDDYREIAPGIVVPHESEVQRDGELVDSVQVLGLDIQNPIPASLFKPGSKD